MRTGRGAVVNGPSPGPNVVLLAEAAMSDARRRCSEGPGDRHPRIGQIGAMGAGAHDSLEVIGQLHVVVANASQGLPHRARDAHSGALRRRTGAAIPAADADRARQLANEELAFGASACAIRPLSAIEVASAMSSSILVSRRR